MAIIVIGGGGRGAGKTALVCGLIRALPEIPWTAVKITSHEHGHPKPNMEPIFEETVAGSATDTARYLTAGAKRALLVTSDVGALGPVMQQILEQCPPPQCLIFESNRVLEHVRADLCLAAAMSPFEARKPSFGLVEDHMDATVGLAGHDHAIDPPNGVDPIHFHLRSFEAISPVMCAWVRERLEKTGNRE
jgi:hypothetical protein